MLRRSLSTKRTGHSSSSIFFIMHSLKTGKNDPCHAFSVKTQALIQELGNLDNENSNNSQNIECTKGTNETVINQDECSEITDKSKITAFSN